MTALVLSGVLCCFLGADDQLIQQLDADYQALLEKEKDPQPMRDAAQALEGTDQRGHWGYLEGLKIIRRTRSKAAIPLLLKYMVRPAHDGRQTTEFAETLTLLTGKTIVDPRRSRSRRQDAGNYVEELVTKWWTPNKTTITTDLGKMSKEELAAVTGELLDKAEKYETEEHLASRPSEPTAYRFYHLLYYHILSDSSARRRTWEKDDLHPAMVPLFLERAGYKETPPDKPEASGHIPYAAVKMLATLRKNGQAPALDKLADDARQNSATRLTCALALYAAGERLKTPVLLDVLDKETDLEPRLVAILALRDSREKLRGRREAAPAHGRCQRRDPHGRDLCAEGTAAACRPGEAQEGPRQRRPAAGHGLHLRRHRRLQEPRGLRDPGGLSPRLPGRR